LVNERDGKPFFDLMSNQWMGRLVCHGRHGTELFGPGLVRAHGKL
jgi:hypothetical protein